jgi:hypothetical protein
MYKMGSHDPFGHLKHKLWSKEKSGVKLTIWLSPTKSWELPQFPYVQVACDISWKALNEGYNLLWASKVAGVPVGTKWHLGVGPVAKHIVCYKGEGGGFPQIQAMVSLVNPYLPMVRPCTKVLQLRIKQLIVRFVQVRVND